VEYALLSECQYKPSVVLVNGVGAFDKAPLSHIRSPVIYADLATCSIDRRLLALELLRSLELIRVYTKQVHSEHYARRPLVMKRGATVGDVARAIHSRLYENFKYAVVWKRDKFPWGQKRVGISYELEDGDVVEIHA